MFEQRDFSFIYKYFTAEKQGGLFILLIGVAAILLAAGFWFFIKTNPLLFKGAAIALLAIGILQSIVGFVVYSKTDKQQSDIAYNLGMQPASYAKYTELPRMEKVMKSFAIYRWTEIVFILIGIVLIFILRNNPERLFWYGFFIAFTIQFAIMLGSDYYAEKRAEVYIEQIRKIIAD